MTPPARQEPKFRRRRRVAALALVLLALIAVWLTLAATVFAPVDRLGAEVTDLRIESAAVGETLGVEVVEPEREAPRGRRSLLVFLHGRGGSDGTFVGNDAVFEALRKLGRGAPVIAFPDGGESSYWHDRDDGDWGRYVIREVIPLVSRRFGIDPGRIAIGGISMGGFGAYDLALDHPRRFCAVGGHSPALWFEAGETAPGAFDDAADFARNDVVARVRRDPDAFGSMRVWNDYGDEDPFRVYDEGFAAAMESGNADFTTHSSAGGHDNAYWNRQWPAYLRFYANSLAHCG